MSIPLVHLSNTERETGGVAVEVFGAGEIKDLKSTVLEEADATDLGDAIFTASAYAQRTAGYLNQKPPRRAYRPEREKTGLNESNDLLIYRWIFRGRSTALR